MNWLSWSVLRWIILALIAVMIPSFAVAQPVSAMKVSPTAEGNVIEFVEGDYILADGLTLPNSGWSQKPTPHIVRINQTDWRTGDFHSVAGRFRFQREVLGEGPFSLYTVSTRNQFSVSVNGVELGRNFGHVSDQILAWYRPYLIAIPADVLKPGINEIIIRVVSQDSVGVGRVLVGPNAPVRDYYLKQYFRQITAPMAFNFAMIVLGGLVFLLWLGRRQEVELLWLALSTLIWFLRNYQYFAEITPFNLALFNALTVYSTYFASVATAAFYFCFTKLPYRNQIIAGLFLFGIPLVLAHAYLSTSNLIFYIPTTMLIIGVAISAVLDFKRHRDLQHGVLALTLAAMPVASLSDVMIARGSHGWDGNDFYLSVFGGLLYCVAFLISFGKRALDAFSALGLANVTLERRIAETRAELAASEAARQELVVGQALAHERERLMQEMHDGIGSNLITALAVARQQKQPDSTIRTLNRALADLKITVDSLEPVEGDLVALIANLRHRMAGDLRDAGIACKWEVGDCGPLPWLDSANALHVLRIFQEAIGNVLAHSGATEMRIGCNEAVRSGIAGIASFVSDNGAGFDADGDSRGKGLSNMQARAQSLSGALECQTRTGAGTIVTLWLPYAR